MVLVVVGGFVLVALIDLPPLIRQRKRRAIAAFICVFAAALTLEVLTVLNIKIPSAMNAWGELIRRIGLAYPR